MVLTVCLATALLSARTCHPYTEITISLADIATLLSWLPGNYRASVVGGQISTRASVPGQTGGGANVTRARVGAPGLDTTEDMEEKAADDTMQFWLPDLPHHLVDGVGDLVAELGGGYSIVSLAQHCSVNGVREGGVVSLGVSVCNYTLSDTLGQERVAGLREWLETLQEGVEDKLVESVMSGNLSHSIHLLPQLFTGAGNTFCCSENINKYTFRSYWGGIIPIGSTFCFIQPK